MRRSRNRPKSCVTYLSLFHPRSRSAACCRNPDHDVSAATRQPAQSRTLRTRGDGGQERRVISWGNLRNRSPGARHPSILHEIAADPGNSGRTDATPRADAALRRRAPRTRRAALATRLLQVGLRHTGSPARAAYTSSEMTTLAVPGVVALLRLPSLCVVFWRPASKNSGCITTRELIRRALVVPHPPDSRASSPRGPRARTLSRLAAHVARPDPGVSATRRGHAAAPPAPCTLSDAVRCCAAPLPPRHTTPSSSFRRASRLARSITSLRRRSLRSAHAVGSLYVRAAVAGLRALRR